ncbi:MAG: NAD(P)H-dependent oxidoreductase subunit E, partial [Maritimibacter sp.]
MEIAHLVEQGFKLRPDPFELSADGKFSWEEVECLGACTNAPMAQVGKDFYEDLTTDNFADLIDKLGAGEVPVPGPQNGRYAAEPLAGLTALTEHESGRTQYNASVALATSIGDTVKRIDGTEVPLSAPWIAGGRKVHVSAKKTPAKPAAKKAAPKAAAPKAAAKAEA